MLLDLGHPLLPHVVIRVGVDDAEADQEDISVGVGNQAQPVKIKVNPRFQDILMALIKSQPIIILLTGRVKELDDVLLVLDLYCYCIVVKHLKSSK